MLPNPVAKLVPKRRAPKPPMAPAALQRATKILELRKSIAEVNSARLQRQAQEARNNVAAELQRLHSNAEGTLPGLRAYMSTRRAQGRRLQQGATL